MQKGQGIAIGVVVVIGAVLAALILRGGSPSLAAGEHGPTTSGAAHEDAHHYAGDDGHDDDEHEHHDALRLDEAALAAAGVTLARAGPASIDARVSLLGEVLYNADRTVRVVPRLAGRVESVAASAGTRVARGEVLAVLSSQALADQRSALLSAEQRLALASRDFERERMLWQERITAEQDFLQARTALAQARLAVEASRQKLRTLGGASGGGDDLTRYELRAPIAGLVTERRLSVGEVVRDDSPVFTISDLSSVWVEAQVPATALAVVREDRPVTVRAEAIGASGEGHIGYLSPLVGEATRAATARIVLANPDGIWRPGLPVTVEVLTARDEVAVAVTAEALQTVEGRTVVFVRHDGAIEARPVETGRRDSRRVEIRAGLGAGDEYAAGGSFVLKAELGKAQAGHEH